MGARIVSMLIWTMLDCLPLESSATAKKVLNSPTRLWAFTENITVHCFPRLSLQPLRSISRPPDSMRAMNARLPSVSLARTLTSISSLGSALRSRSPGEDMLLPSNSNTSIVGASLGESGVRVAVGVSVGLGTAVAVGAGWLC